VEGRRSSGDVLQPGEKIDGMVVGTGIKNAYPLSAFCTPKKENDHSIRVDCRELSMCANLGIGQAFGMMDLIPPSISWEDLTWQLSVDGHPIDLEAFGLYEFAYPTLAPSPSPVREVSKVARSCDVVLVKPTPGDHTLQGRAQSQDGATVYTWVVNFAIAAR
jgi:hypothetical protein